jgi:hypothetical protein
MIGVWFPAAARNFSLPQRDQTGFEAHPASYPVGTGNSFRGVKRPGRKADHSPPSSAEVKECVELYIHSRIRLHGVVLKLPMCLVKHMVSFTFIPLLSFWYRPLVCCAWCLFLHPASPNVTQIHVSTLSQNWPFCHPAFSIGYKNLGRQTLCDLPS